MTSAAASTHAGQFALLEVALPGSAAMAAGVLLLDAATDQLWVRLRRDWDAVAPDEADFLAAIEDDLRIKAREFGAGKCLGLLEESLSNVLRVTERQQVLVEDFGRALERLYRQHVASTVQPFVTHIPRYSLAVAAGKFLENQEIEEEAWEEAPPDLRVDEHMFAATIVGRSMEPRIPDGSLCVFRAGVTGSRQGRLVLVEALGRGANDHYTVKRYTSEKSGEGDSWKHGRIRLEPLNPEFEAWDLDPEEDRYRILAEFVRVLD